MVNKEKCKLTAARAAVEYIKDNQIVGIGSGSTITHAIHCLGEKIQTTGIKIMAVPTSYQSAMLLTEYYIPITTLNEHPVLDIAIDGTDEVDPNFNLIKGGGAALTQEKIIDSAAKKLIIIADESKKVKFLGEKAALPIEVIPIALKTVSNRIKELTTEIQLRMAAKKLGPVVTDNGNFIIDARFSKIKDPESLEKELNVIPGVVENGLFVNITDIVIIGYEDKVDILEKK
ncbi:MAG: ribose-5-phosphate isomerase RpiA [Candidatus Helarchaeota archaeon]|nr:ribose-5-phosphate isomerase RpiA [Candidatus Helarchaeota archaeon]